MESNKMILGQDQYYSLDCYETQLNNNVLIVGASGAGKTRGIVCPNLLQATGSYIISDPKGNLYQQYKEYLENSGYLVKKLDFTNPTDSVHYNFFPYIRNTQDIIKIAHMLIYQRKSGGHQDPFWDEASQLLLQAVIAYICEEYEPQQQNFETVNRLIGECQTEGSMSSSKTLLDTRMEELKLRNPQSYAVKTYEKFRVAADKTLRSILISVNARIGLYDVPELNEMMRFDEVNVAGIGKQKTALFVVVSDTERSMDNLVNIFFTQSIHELCHVADTEYVDNCLPIPVRFILDDFATNCKIEEFPRMIASIRSRNISTMLMIQAEAQLEAEYGRHAKTIIGNCDSYVYLGGNDVETAKSIAERCDRPVQEILHMPIGTNWIFRRGQKPVHGKNFELEPFLYQKKYEQNRGCSAKAGR